MEKDQDQDHDGVEGSGWWTRNLMKEKEQDQDRGMGAALGSRTRLIEQERDEGAEAKQGA